VKIDVVGFGLSRRIGPARRASWRGTAAEPIIQAEAELLKLEVGIDLLRSAEKRAAELAVVGEQVFEPRRPSRMQKKAENVARLGYNSTCLRDVVGHRCAVGM
jgi:hypothetical protein